MTEPEPKTTRVRKLKAAGLGAGAIGAGLLLSACFGPGTIATQIGNGTAGYTGDGGKASAATLHSPQAVAVDPSGNAYVADTTNCVIRKYTKSTGNISTVAGNGTCGLTGDSGPATSAELNHPIGVAVGTDGKLYIADADNNRIRTVTLSSGTIATYAGSSLGAADGDRLTTAKFSRPVGVAFDAAQNLYVADSQNDAIREIDHTSGLVSTVAGSLGVPGNTGDNGPATSATLNDPEAITIDQFDEVFIADAGNCRVRWIDSGAGMNGIAGTTCGYSGDGADASLAQFSHMRGLAVDPDLNIYVADTGNNRVRMISGIDNSVSTVAGTGTAGYSGDNGAGTAATLSGPTGLAIIPHDTLWIADTGNNRVRIFGLTPLPTTTTSSTSTSTTSTSTTTTLPTT
ncbi:MAG TPA: hypothetical protein VID05_05315 [Acidimicrobiales bacterium]